MVQTFLAFLNQISANYPLHFFLPAAAMIIMAFYYLLNRKEMSYSR